MSVYCTREDMERRWGMKDIRKWADLDGDGDADKIQTQTEWAIQSVGSRIDADFASSIYVTPFNPIPSEVRRHAAALAGCELFKCRMMAATNDSSTIQRAEKEYEDWKTQVFSGIQIPDAAVI